MFSLREHNIIKQIAYYDTNEGQGWDINGKHYNNMGEYDDSLFKNTEADDDVMTDEELEAFLNGEQVEGF